MADVSFIPSHNWKTVTPFCQETELLGGKYLMTSHNLTKKGKSEYLTKRGKEL